MLIIEMNFSFNKLRFRLWVNSIFNKFGCHQKCRPITIIFEELRYIDPISLRKIHADVTRNHIQIDQENVLNDAKPYIWNSILFKEPDIEKKLQLIAQRLVDAFQGSDGRNTGTMEKFEKLLFRMQYIHFLQRAEIRAVSRKGPHTSPI